MKKNKKAFSLVIAMWIVLVSTLLAYTILEYIVPFSKNVYWVWNSAKAYYNANKGVEKWLYFFSTRGDANIMKEVSISSTWYTVNTFSSGSVLPKPWEWDSEYDSNWNTISVWSPIQLSVWYGFVDLNDLNIYFRTPEINGSRWDLRTGSWYISWQISSSTGSLNSNSWSVINESGMDVDAWKSVSIKNLEWTSYDSFWNQVNGIEIEDIFGSAPYSGVAWFNCSDVSQKCILKFSLIDALETTSWNPIPYLEWKVEDGSSPADSLPLRYSIIESVWKSRNFWRELKVRHPQSTLNQAFDFAVFQ